MMPTLLLSKNPLTNSLKTKAVSDFVGDYIETATRLNIATGYISNESIARLKHLIEYRNQAMSLSLLIGMNYLDGFTKLQYDAVCELDEYLKERNIGHVYVSPRALFHGKMYSFMHEDHCLGAFIGSSNLGSFIGTTQNYIEADICFPEDCGRPINQQIEKLTESIGKPITEAAPITSFKTPGDLLDGYEHVEKLSHDEYRRLRNKSSDIRVIIPLKTCPKSNLNSYFGAGKIPNRFSRRDYYEVEIILSKNLENLSFLPDKEEGSFSVITPEGYKFECSRQGDYGKNLRSSNDLRILGKWIKGQMENAGALKLGERVNEDTLEKFGKKNMVLTQSIDKSFWLLTLE